MQLLPLYLIKGNKMTKLHFKYNKFVKCDNQQLDEDYGYYSNKYKDKLPINEVDYKIINNLTSDNNHTIHKNIIDYKKDYVNICKDFEMGNIKKEKVKKVQILMENIEDYEKVLTDSIRNKTISIKGRARYFFYEDGVFEEQLLKAKMFDKIENLLTEEQKDILYPTKF